MELKRCVYHGHGYAENHPCPMCLDAAREIDRQERVNNYLERKKGTGNTGPRNYGTNYGAGIKDHFENKALPK